MSNLCHSVQRMQFLLETLKLIEAAVSSDKVKAVAYARQLATKLEQVGELKAAERIQRVLSSQGSSSIGTAGVVQDRLPVDGESRLSLADETWIKPEDVEVFLSPESDSVVQEFLCYVEAADRLIAEGVGVSASLLMYGPPGCGKTEVARLISARLGLPLITARADSLISSYLGSTSKNLRMLFDHVSSRPCVLFLDEFDAIAKLRDDRHELGELKRVVVSLLQNIDAIRSHTVILAATNHEHLLDPAIWRRFTYRIKVGLPGLESRIQLFRKFLGLPLPDKVFHRFAEASEGMSGSDIRDICEGARRAAILQRSETNDGEVFRRILLRGVDGESLTTPELIRRAKEMNPNVFTHRVLAEAFGMSPGNITHILKKREESET